jgi:hypothetical protein
MKNQTIIPGIVNAIIIIALLSITTNCKKDETLIKKDPVITWENPADISYGTMLSDIQLNATADAPGTFVYTPPAGTKLSIGANQDLKVDFIPTDTKTYNTKSKTVTINVLEASIKDGIWTGKYNSNLELSIIVKSKKIIRVDIVYQTSDLDYQGSTLKNTTYGPFSIGDKALLDISSTTTINDNDVDVKVSVNLNFVSETEASGQIEYSENSTVIKTSDVEINWKQEMPETGFIRDGNWSGYISSPIYVSFSFSTLNGLVDGINYFYFDSQTMSFGSIDKSGTISIGDDFNFSINQSIDVSIHFSSYMIGSGTILLDLVGGNQSIPVDCNWALEFPSDKKSSSIAIKQTQLMNKYNKSNIRGCLNKNK